MILLSFFFLMSGTQKEPYPSQVDNVQLVQLREMINTVTDLSCDGFDSLGCEYDTSNISKHFSTFLQRVDAAKPLGRGSLDTRMKVYVTYLDGRKDIYCFGYSSKFYKNGNLMELQDEDFFRELIHW